ncbi:uncharacterized protein TM35_000031850, partial [Trypanosoma theileri]
GVAMSFGTGNEEKPASAAARRGGVAMSFGTDLFGSREAGWGNEFVEREEALGRKTVMNGGDGENGWRRSVSYRSPNAQRYTLLDNAGFAKGGPTSAAAVDDDGSPMIFASTARPHMDGNNDLFSNVNTGNRAPQQNARETLGAPWRASSPAPAFNEGGRVNPVSSNTYRAGGQRSAMAREDSPAPGFAPPISRSRPTSVLDPFRTYSTRLSARPGLGTPYQSTRDDTRFNPPHTDRWHSHDVSNDLYRPGATEPPSGSFWRPSSFGAPYVQGASDPLTSPVSSMSRSGILAHEEVNSYQRNRVGGPFPDPFQRFSQRSPFERNNTASHTLHSGTSMNHTSNTVGSFGTSSGNNWNRSAALPNRTPNRIFERMATLYDNGASRLPIIDEYDYPRSGSRVRPRGVQAMDVAWSHEWNPSPAIKQSKNGFSTLSSRPNTEGSTLKSRTMLRRNTTTTTTNSTTARRLGRIPISRPPLAPASRTPPLSRVTSTTTTTTGLRSTVAPSSVRGLTLRERVLLRQQQQRREANLEAYNTNLRENYCVGNDIKRVRMEPTKNPFTSSTSSLGALDTPGTLNQILSNANTPPENNAALMETNKLAEASINSYKEQVDRLKSLTSPFVEADGINVSFCLRDLANLFLHLPKGSPKEYDLIKAAWFDEGVSYFVSSKPTMFCGGWESYLKHLNLYQQPFYLREKAFICVLRVPYQPQLRVCVAVHNLDDFIAILQQKPLAKIIQTKEEKWMQERLYGTEAPNNNNSSSNSNDDDNNSNNHPESANTVKNGFLPRLFQRLYIKKKVGSTVEVKNENKHRSGWSSMRWSQRWALLRLQLQATIQGRAWKVCTTPHLTDPTILQSRMSFLSNRTATYAALRHKLNTIETYSATLAKKQQEVDLAQRQVRMIKDRIGSLSSIQLGCDAAKPPCEQELKQSLQQQQQQSLHQQDVGLSRGIGTSTTSNNNPLATKPKRVPFRVDRIGNGAATATRTFRTASSLTQSTNSTTPTAVENSLGKQEEMPKMGGSTIASYASSVNISRPQTPKPTPPLSSNTTTNGGGEEGRGGETTAAGALIISHNSEYNVLVQVAERIRARKNFAREVLPPPLITVLKFVSSIQENDQQQRVFNACPTSSLSNSGKLMSSVFAGPLPTPTEIHRQEDSFDITVSHLQQLMQWQWEYHQNSYEGLPLPIFRGTLVTSTAAYFGVSVESKNGEGGLGISPLSRSLLLSLTKWGWMVPVDYKASRNDGNIHFLERNNTYSLFGLQMTSFSSGKLWLWIVVFTVWQTQALWFILVYIIYKCFSAAFKNVFGYSTRWPAPLDSATSIVYRQSEAAVEAMLEDRQYFRTQLLATRILQAQHYIQNVMSRMEMLLRGHSPLLSFIIGLEVFTIWLLFMGCNFILQFLPPMSILLDLMMGPFLSVMKPYTSLLLNMHLIKWSISLLQPGSGNVNRLEFIILLYLLWRLVLWSPMRWMWRTTWDMFLHDDALVRRPLLSF